MDSNFDLNINNYTIKELEELFELPNNYDESIIEMRETKLRDNIVHDKSIPIKTKNMTLDFINNVKKKLTENQKSNSNSSQNSISELKKSFDNIYNTDKSLQKSELIDSGNQNLIKQKVTPFGQSAPSEFYQGTLDPLKKRILTQNINIDTRFRENYYATSASNFHFDLPLKLSKVVSLQLASFEFQNTVYAISKDFGNNFFVLEVPNTEPLVVTLPDGNYDFFALQEYINNFLSSIAPVEYSNIQFLVDVNTPMASGPNGGTGKMIVGSTTGDVTFSINFLTDSYGNEDRLTPLPLKFGWLIGFRDGFYENNKTYASEGMVNLSGPKYIQKIQIQLLDEYGRILNLNNMDYSFCLTFKTIYDL
jgi:hypothetical protein